MRSSVTSLIAFITSRKWLQQVTLASLACIISLIAVACVGGSDPTPSVTAQDDAPAAAVVSSLDSIIESGTIKIGVPQDFAPFGSVDANGDLEGYDIDVATLLAENLGVELELVPVISDNRIPFLQTNKADLVISSMGANPERAKSIFFSIPYAPFFSGIYGSSDISGVGGFGDLGGYKVGVTQGTLEDLELTDATGDDVSIERFADNSLTASALISGQVDMIATGNVVAAELSKNNPDKSIEGKFIIKESPAHIGLRRGEIDLLQWVNTFVYHKRLGGDLDNFSQKWLGEPLPPLPAF
ncbi:MAG: transporter substrate-binding domain-containing protein [Merismopedia sp. SIO2A8]|nr:transporter substrate-binding domain-containing protein [Symploca sp. SIO2B6]NET51675.1 transporter substrate-binding domain-containing protein [Merismopedia sp. SIO2A8]